MSETKLTEEQRKIVDEFMGEGRKWMGLAWWSVKKEAALRARIRELESRIAGLTYNSTRAKACRDAEDL